MPGIEDICEEWDSVGEILEIDDGGRRLVKPADKLINGDLIRVGGENSDRMQIIDSIEEGEDNSAWINLEIDSYIGEQVDVCMKYPDDGNGDENGDGENKKKKKRRAKGGCC